MSISISIQKDPKFSKKAPAYPGLYYYRETADSDIKLVTVFNDANQGLMVTIVDDLEPGSVNRKGVRDKRGYAVDDIQGQWAFADITASLITTAPMAFDQAPKGKAVKNETKEEVEQMLNEIEPMKFYTAIPKTPGAYLWRSNQPGKSHEIKLMTVEIVRVSTVEIAGVPHGKMCLAAVPHSCALSVRAPIINLDDLGGEWAALPW